MIVTLSIGIRQGFGLWLQPITMDRGWHRETLASALLLASVFAACLNPHPVRALANQAWACF